MATKIASLFAEVGADISGLSKGLSEAKTELSSTASEMGSTGNTLSANLAAGFGAIATAAGVASASVVGIGAAMDQAFELGAQGAAITQTAESFDRLVASIGVVPDLLGQLRAASRGTISDLGLMSSTITLLTGTSGDLSVAMAEAAPRLLEIAKAANKLNPTLGDTAFLYQSLATGIKRNSPLLIDNTGLVVKVGEANAVMAEQLGKTVGELTATEQQMALLNATLQAGDVLLGQVGGSADAAGDSFARLDVSVDTLKNSIMEKLAPGLASAAEALNIIIDGQNQIDEALNRVSESVVYSSTTYEEYVAAVKNAAESAGYLVDASGVVKFALRDMLGMQTKVFDSTMLLSQSEWEAANAAGTLGAALEALPSDVRTTMHAQGFDAAITAANRVTAAVNRIPSVYTIHIRAQTSQAYAGIEAAGIGGIPSRQGGGMVHEAVTQINEKGHELIALPTGSMVIPHERSQRMMGGGPTWNGDLIVQGGNNPMETAMAVQQMLQDRGMIPRVPMR